MLQPDKLKKLNENALKMSEAGKSKEEILAMKDAFIKQFGETEPVKKKDGTKAPSTSTTQPVNTESVQKDGSLDFLKQRPQSPTDIVLEGNKQIAQNQKPSVAKTSFQEQTKSADPFKNEYKDPLTGKVKKTTPTTPENKNIAVANEAYNYAIQNVDEQKSLERLNDELNTSQFTDGIKDGLKGVFNTFIANPLNMINSSLGGDKDFRIGEYKPLELELKTAKDELREELGEKTPITQAQIQKRAEEIFLKKDKIEQLSQLIDEALPRGYDREGVWKELKLKQLRSNDKLRSTVASVEVFNSQIKEFHEYYKSLPDNNLSAEQIKKFDILRNKAVTAVEGLNYIESNYDNYLKEAKTDEEKLELFKYNYNDFEKNPTLLWNTAKNIVAGTTKILADTSIYANKLRGDYVNPIAQSLSEMSSEELNENEAESGQFYRYKASNINSWSDLGSLTTQLFSEQIPVLASIYVGGNAGIGAVSLSSGGQKINELEEQAKQPFGKIYSDGEKLAAGYLYAGAEFFPEKFGTARILKDLERTVSSASSASRKLFQDGFLKSTINGIKNTTKNTFLEGGTEYITAEGQIAIDKDLLGIIESDYNKNQKRAEGFFSGALMGGSMSAVGGSIGFGIAQSKLYSDRQDVKKVQAILANIDLINSEIENNKALSDSEKNELYSKMNQMNNQAFAIVEKNAMKGANLSVREKSFLLDVNQKQNLIREKVSEIKNSNYSDAVKKEMLNDLKSEFETLEENRNKTLNGKYDSSMDSKVKQQKTEIKDAETQSAVAESEIESETEVQKQTEAEKVTGVRLFEYNGNTYSFEGDRMENVETKLMVPSGKWEEIIQNGKEITQPQAEVQETEQEILVDETQTQGDIATNRNVRPTVSENADVAIDEKPATEVTETEVVESTVEPIASKEDSKEYLADTVPVIRFNPKGENEILIGEDAISAENEIEQIVSSAISPKQAIAEANKQGLVFRNGAEKESFRQFVADRIEGRTSENFANWRKDTNKKQVKPKSSEVDSKVKKYKLSANGQAFNVERKNGVLQVTNSQGKPVSKPTERAVLRKHADSIDFTQGKKASESENFTPSEEFITDQIIELSENPAEIAAEIEYISYKDPIDMTVAERKSYKEQIIADEITAIKEEGFFEQNDINNLENVEKTRKAYFSEEGRSIDELAKEMSEQAGITIEPSDIADFIAKYPLGKKERLKTFKDEMSQEQIDKSNKVEDLKTKFTQITGLEAKKEFLLKAIEQSNRKSELNSVLDQMTDEEFAELDKTINQIEQETYGKNEQAPKGDNQSKSNKVSGEKPGIQKEPARKEEVKQNYEMTREEYNSVRQRIQELLSNAKIMRSRFKNVEDARENNWDEESIAKWIEFGNIDKEKFGSTYDQMLVNEVKKGNVLSKEIFKENPEFVKKTQESIDNGNFKERIKSGKITKENAIQIIENAGLKVPNSILEIPNSKIQKEPTRKEEIITVYHGGIIENYDDGGDLYVTEDKNQANLYAKGNEGGLYSFEIDKSKVAPEELARSVIKNLGLKTKSKDYSNDELKLHELIDPKFDKTALSDSDRNKLYKELGKRGFEAVSFVDEDLDGGKLGVENIAIFGEKPKTKEVLLKQREADQLFSKGYRPIINGVVEKDFTQEQLDDYFEENDEISMTNNFSVDKPTRKESRKQAVEVKIDEIANAIKGLESIYGIRIKAQDSDSKTQGTSRDQLIDFIAKTAKEIAKTGIEIDEAIRAVIAELRKSFDVDVELDEVKKVIIPEVEEKPQALQPKGKPSASKDSRREKSSEEIAQELGVSHDDYLDLKDFVANEPKSGLFNEYLSAETIADVFGDKPTNDQNYEQLVLTNAIQHGNNVLEKAKNIFGEDYMAKTLEFLQNAKLGNFEKAVVYAALENEIDTLVKANPKNVPLKAMRELIYADSQANLRNSSKGINAGRLRRIHNAIKNGYDIDKLTSGLISPKQEEAKQALKDAVPTGENLNKASEQEENAEVKTYTQEEFDAELKKAIQEARSKNRGDLSKKGKEIADKIRRLKLNKDVAKADLSLGAYDLAIETIAQLVEKGATVAQAIKNVLADAKFKDVDADKLRQDILGVIKTPKIRDIVKQALIDAGFSREITVTKNQKDIDGNDVLDANGKKVKVKEKKEVLDWVKLTGRMNSVEALRKNVEDKLKEQGYTDSQISEISNELEAEYIRLTEDIADKAMADLERKNQITPTPNRKSDLDRLVEYHSKGLFAEDAKQYERLINKIVGISKREQDVLDKIEAEIEKIKNLREVKIDGKLPDAKSIDTQVSQIAKNIRNIITWANLKNSPISLKVWTVIADIAGISRAAVLGNLYNAAQNIYANKRASFLAKAKYKLKGYSTPELNSALNEFKNVVMQDVLVNRGVDFGDSVSPFSNHSIFIEKLKDYIMNKTKGSKQKALMAVLNTFEGRLFLNIMDSRYKSKIVNIDFIMNAVDVLTSEREGKQKMTKKEAVEFVSNALTGVNLEKAKVLAKKFIKDVNAKEEGTLIDNDYNVNRLAFDIMRENLTSGNNFTMEEINDLYQAAMKSGGLNIGHESNNLVSKYVKLQNNDLDKQTQDAIKDKNYQKASLYTFYSMIYKNFINPYVGGGMNWAIIEGEAGTPLGIATGLNKMRQNNEIDMLTDVGKKRLKEDLANKRDAESKLFRGIWGTMVGITTFLTYQGIKALSVAGDDDEENKRLLNQYLKENPEQRKIFDKFSPEILAYSLAVSDERLAKWLLNKLGYKTDQNDNVLTLIKSLQDKNSSSLGTLGVLVGQTFSTPGSWRIIRDTQRLSRELKGEPMNQTQYKVTSFLNGYFKGAFIDYIGKRPGVNYDLENVKKDVRNEKTKFTKETNGIANDITSGKITIPEAVKIINEKYAGKPELIKKAEKVAVNAIKDQKVREGLKDADAWYMEFYNERETFAKAYILYQNVYKNKDFKKDAEFIKNLDLATTGMSQEKQAEIAEWIIQFKDVEESKKDK